MSVTLSIINVVMIVVFALIGLARSKTGNMEIHTSVWAEDPVDAD